mmetsp:Transcript_27628/g.59019  ORF Transcript_27628/g.59019 Transcript_27628/m.59019 type:complete len:260 (-) Transcript_27628:36-815(-)
MMLHWFRRVIIPTNMEEGDFLVINTRLWWHQMMIPSGNNEDNDVDNEDDDDGGDGLSVNIARDMYFREHHADRPPPTTSSNHSLMAAAGVVDHSSDWNEEHDEISREKDKQKYDCMENVEASWASGFIPKGTILLVDQTVDGDEEEDWGNDDNGRDNAIASLYHHLLPPTIGRTTIESKANCRLVLQEAVVAESYMEDEGEEEDDNVDCNNQGGTNPHRNVSDRNQKQAPREPAMETTQDIHEGEEFVVLVVTKSKDVR